MAFVVTSNCIGCLDGACVKVCPVDCIYLGERSRYINPNECIDCGACEPACPVQAIYPDVDTPDELQMHVADNEAFFRDILPGRSAPIGNPKGAKRFGEIRLDTPYIADLPAAPQ